MPRGTQCHMAPTSKVGRDWCLGARFRGASVAATEARQTDTRSQRDAPRFTVARVRRTCRASRPPPKRTTLHLAAPQFVLHTEATRSERAEVNQASAHLASCGNFPDTSRPQMASPRRAKSKDAACKPASNFVLIFSSSSVASCLDLSMRLPGCRHDVGLRASLCLRTMWRQWTCSSLNKPEVKTLTGAFSS